MLNCLEISGKVFEFFWLIDRIFGKIHPISFNSNHYTKKTSDMLVPLWIQISFPLCLCCTFPLKCMSKLGMEIWSFEWLKCLPCIQYYSYVHHISLENSFCFHCCRSHFVPFMSTCEFFSIEKCLLLVHFTQKWRS